MKPLVCAQCATWRDAASVTFATVEEAEEHVINVHPNRFIIAWRMFVNQARSFEAMTHAMKRRTE